MEKANNKLKPYYEALGAERIKALGYKEKALENEIIAEKNNLKIRLMLKQKLIFGEEYTSQQIKTKMNEVFAEAGVKKKGKISDLRDLYGFNVIEHNRRANEGNRKRYYEIRGTVCS